MTGTNLEEVVRIFDDSGTPLEGLDLDPEAAMKWVGNAILANRSAWYATGRS